MWLVDPVDGPEVDAHVRALGEPAGVVQLIDRHDRDCALLAERYGVPHHRVPLDGLPGSPFEVIRILDVPGWHEAALWWRDERVLVCTEALGTTAYFLGPDERLGVHPFLRLYQPKALREIARSLSPRHVLVGHGEGIHGGRRCAGCVGGSAERTARGAPLDRTPASKEATMRADLTIGGTFPDLRLPETTGKELALSEIAAAQPLVLAFMRGWWCPKEQVRLREPRLRSRTRCSASTGAWRR